MANNKTEELKQEWADDNKKPLSAYSIGSHVKGWWICIKGHRWKAEIRSRFNGTGCPYCSGRCAIPGETDLQTVDPELAAEWNKDRNLITPDQVSRFSHKKIYWNCPKGHVYKMMVANRSQGKECPICYKWRIKYG